MSDQDIINVAMGRSNDPNADVYATAMGGWQDKSGGAVTLTLSGPLTFASGAAAGTLVSNIGNVPAGATPTLTPNDGRLAIAGDATNGWKVVVGLTTANAGNIALAVAATGANGASATVTVTAAATNAAYSISQNAGAIQGFPAGMSTTASSGPYWPNLVDLRNESFPADWALWYSPDHSDDNGGMFLSLCRGDPMVAANWRTYDQAIAAGWLDSIGSKPAGNPIFSTGSAGFTSVETPCIVKVGSKWVITFHVNNATGGLSYQETFRATSDDMLNWTLPANRGSALLVAYATDPPGDGHTGYFSWAANPIVELLNPATGAAWKYIGYSLFGGTARANSMQWATDDPVAGSWSKLGPVMVIAGRVAEATSGLGFLSNGFSAGSIRPLGNGRYSILAEGSTVGSSGAAGRVSAVYELVLNATGRQIVAKPKPVLSPASGTFYSTEVGQPSVVRDATNNRFLMVYQGADDAAKNKIGIASGPLVDPATTSYTALSPDIAARQASVYSFRGASAIPSGMSVLLTGTPAATVTGYNAEGVELSARAGSSMDSEAVLSTTDGLIPANHDFIDFLVDGMRESRTDFCFRRITAGFATTKVATASMANMLYVQNTTTAGATSIAGLTKRSRVNGVEQTAVGSDLYPGFGDDTLGFWKATHTFGIRWYPKIGKAYVLGGGMAEIEEIAVPASLDLSVPYFPFLSIKAASTSTNDFERIQGFIVGKKVT